MTEFRSQLEDLIPAEELLFDSTPGFGSVYKKFLSHAIAHPAKMNTRLTEFLVEKFTQEGDVVLDPMSGSGQTGVIAALRGRDAVCVELEEKFFGWMEKARLKVERQRTLAVKGKIRNICGDSRKLSRLLKEADVVVTSPPYSNGFRHNPQDKEKRLQRLIEVDKKGVEKGQKWGITSREALERRLAGQDDGYGESKENIGNLPLGEVDAIVTSPPYSESVGKKAGGRMSWCSKGEKRRQLVKYSESEQNIGNLSHGKIDAIVTSPPYKTANEGGGLNKNPPKTFRGVLKNHSFKISDNPENIDNLPYPTKVDAVITSPPYAEKERWQRYDGEKGFHSYDKNEAKNRCKRDYEPPENVDNIGNLPFADIVITSPPYEAAMSAKVHTLNTEKQRKIYGEKHWATQYGKADEQIGNLSKETYLEAMLKVYSEMFKVLKPNGKAIIIIKPFIRNKKVVDLPFHTYLLLKNAGFKLTKLFKLRLKQQSFWRILYHKKYPKVPQIQHEYILVCQKHHTKEEQK